MDLQTLKAQIGQLEPSASYAVSGVTVTRQPFGGYVIKKGVFSFHSGISSDVCAIVDALLNENTKVYITAPGGVRERSDNNWTNMLKSKSNEGWPDKGAWFKSILSENNIVPKFFGSASYNYGQQNEYVVIV